MLEPRRKDPGHYQSATVMHATSLIPQKSKVKWQQPLLLSFKKSFQAPPHYFQNIQASLSLSCSFQMPKCLASCRWSVFLPCDLYSSSRTGIWASGQQQLCQSELICHPAQFSKTSSLPLIWALRDILWEKELQLQNKSPESFPSPPGLKTHSSGWCSRQLLILSTFSQELSPLINFFQTSPSRLIIYRCHDPPDVDSGRLVTKTFCYFCPFIQT